MKPSTEVAMRNVAENMLTMNDPDEMHNNPDYNADIYSGLEGELDCEITDEMVYGVWWLIEQAEVIYRFPKIPRELADSITEAPIAEG